MGWFGALTSKNAQRDKPDRESASQTWRHVADQLRARWPKLGTLMDESETDVLAYMSFPASHRCIR